MQLSAVSSHSSSSTTRTHARTHARTASTRAAAETTGGVASKNNTSSSATLAKQQQIAPTPPPAAIQAETLPLLPPPPQLLPPPSRSPSHTPTCASQSLPPSPLSLPAHRILPHHSLTTTKPNRPPASRRVSPTKPGATHEPSALARVALSLCYIPSTQPRVVFSFPIAHTPRAGAWSRCHCRCHYHYHCHCHCCCAPPTTRLTFTTIPTSYPPSRPDLTGHPHFHSSLQLYCACRTRHNRPTLQQWPKC